MARKERKGISGIVAALFIIAIIIGGYNLVMLGINQYGLYNTALVEKTSAQLNKINEEFRITDARIDNNKFNLTMSNTGSVAIGLIRLWVTNQTDGWYNNYTLASTIGSGQTITNLGQSLPLTAKNSSSYLFKAVTERGNAATFKLLAPSQGALKMSLFAVPRSISTGQNVTILFGVANNLTDGSIVQSVMPKVPLNFTKIEASTGTTTAGATLMEGPTPTVEQSLTLGETAFFKWVYKIVGDKGDKILFNATIVDAKKGNYVVEPAEVVVDILSEQSGVALQATGISITQDDESGTLHFHVENTDVPNALLAGHQAQSAYPDVTATTTATLNLVTPSIWFLTKNITSSITTNSGNWNLTLYYKSGVGSGSHSINATYQIWDSTNTIKRSKILSFLISAPTTNAFTKLSPPLQTTGSNIQLAGGDRLRITLSYVSGAEFILRYDESGFDSFLKTPPQTPIWPLYQTYSGGSVSVIIKNTGPHPIWVDASSRVVFTHSANAATYSGLITNWEDPSGTPKGTVGSTSDSIVVTPGNKIRLIFTESCKIPTTSACATGDKASSNKGNFDVAVRVSGYDKDGGFVLRVVKIGIVVV